MLILSVALGACGGDEEVVAAARPHHAEPRMRKLLASQYVASVKALLGPAAASVARPPPDIASQGFDAIGAAELAISEPALAAYEQSAQAIANRIVADVSNVPALMGCTPAGAGDAACFETFVRGFGRRAFRRPLTDEERARYVGLATTTAARYQNAYAGTAYALMAFLQSPYFLYQVEVGEPDPAEPTRRRLTGSELATRMAYFLTDAPPDAALLDAAEAGQLATPEAVRAIAQQLVERPEARDALDSFYDERFKLRQLASLTKDPAVFPQFTPALGAAMRQEALLLLRDVVWTNNSDYRDLFTAPYAYVNTALAQLYGTMPVNGGGFERRFLPPDRQGVLGSGAFLAREAHPGFTSPTRRGRFISERVLCIDIPPPPPEVMAQPPAPIPGMPMTMRQRLRAHAANEACASCHARMDGIGLALENFDGLGAFRTQDTGLPIDASGEIFEVGTFRGLAGLTALVRERPELHRCWVRSLYRHATGHLEAEADEAALLDVDQRFEAARYRLKDLLVEIVASDAFRFVDNPEAK
ncbi:MAG TPA: DUF1592 domain-containing protein [Kofleriaceae bacterium]|nr:DUF1592 domain-containing protein [Kofleriaceae bacterium]